MAESSITALAQRIADSVPFVVRVEWEPDSLLGLKLTLICLYGYTHVEMLSREALARDPRFMDFVCEDLRHTIMRALSEHLAQKWERSKQGAHCVGLFTYGAFTWQTSLSIPPPTQYPATLPHEMMDRRNRVVFALTQYDPVTRVAIYRSRSGLDT